MEILSGLLFPRKLQISPLGSSADRETSGLITPAEETEWDDFVKSHPLGWVTHLSAWKHVLERSFPQIRGSLLVLRGRNGSIRAGLPIYEVKSLLTGKRLVSIPFATRSHPICQDPEDLKILFSEILRMGVERQIPRVSIQCVASEETLEQVAGNVVSNRFKAHTLQLSPGSQVLFNRLHTSAIKKKIRRAEKHGVLVRALSSDEDLRTFYKLYSVTRKRIGLPPHPELFVRNLWEQFAPKDQMEGFLAERDGAAVAGLLVFKFRDRVSAEYLGSKKESHSYGAVQLLYWHSIVEASRQGYLYFDFGRTDERNIGLMEFKNRWGTSVTSLPIYSQLEKPNATRALYGESKRTRILKEVLKRTPVPILTEIGKYYYRHLG